MDTIIRSARIADDRSLVDIAIQDGKVFDVAPRIDAEANDLIDADGRVVIPAFVDSHIHLDKAHVMDRISNRSGTLAEAIRATAAVKSQFSRDDILERAARTIRSLIRYGTTSIRSHVEFDPAQGLVGLETAFELKEQFRHVLDMQIVAFPQEGIFKCPGTDRLMELAMDMGADVVGAVPYNDSSATDHIDFAFDLANRFGKPLDLHQDFSDDADRLSIEYVCDKTVAEGMEGLVSVGHLTAIAALPAAELDAVIEKIAKARLNVMCLPATDLHLGARNDVSNVRRCLTPVRKLRDAGVNVCLATNNIRNAFTPFGNGDLLQIALLAVPACHLGGDDDLPTVLPMITYNAAKALALENYGIDAGDDADLLIVDSRSLKHTVIDLPERLFVIKNGKTIVKSTVETIYDC